MKKLIVAIVLATVLIAGGLGGFAYANNNSHVPMTGQKLVGWGAFGPDPPDTFFNAVFLITNPDCVSEITIDQLSIISALGTVVYEGPYLDREGNLVPQTLGPHEMRGVVLTDYIDEPPVHAMGYTVEIFWTWTDKKGLPLMGTAYHHIDDPSTRGFATTQMVNMEQTLKP
ncbi:hypothetical protein ES702_00287 [subsurface metagenome]